MNKFYESKLFLIPCLLIVLVFNAYAYMADGSDNTKYNRKDYTGSSAWIDADKDCQNTRAEVLVEESIDSVVFRKGKTCVVDSGLWLCPFTGKLYKKANDLDIDHIVALEDAHRSGAMYWSKDEKKAFANYMEDRGHLIAVYKSENRKKGSKGPEDYLPPDPRFQKEYCRIYVRIKVRFGLTSNRKQLLFLQNMFINEPGIKLPNLGY